MKIEENSSILAFFPFRIISFCSQTNHTPISFGNSSCSKLLGLRLSISSFLVFIIIDEDLEDQT